jgi:hypothetical protein
MHSLVATGNATATIAAALLAAGCSTAGYIGTAGRTASDPTDSGYTIDDRGAGMMPTITSAWSNLVALETLNRRGSEGDSGFAAGPNRHSCCGLGAGQVS